MEPMKLHGRRKLTTDFTEITSENVKEALGKAMARHVQNAQEIQYLFDYYRGIQPVQKRVKDVRPDIVHNTVINHASEIVSFKVSYLLSDPVVYVSRNGNGEVSAAVSKNLGRFNDIMHTAGLSACDKELADDFTICGQAYRLTLANPRYPEFDDCPVTVQTLDPARTGVVYENSSAKHTPPVFAFTYVDRDGRLGRLTRVWTRDKVFTIERGTVTEEPNGLGMIPVVEYVNNAFRIGAFEPVLDILDDINILESNRIEATEQAVQNLTIFRDVELDEEQVEKLKSSPSAFIFLRTLKDTQSPDIRNLTTDLNQSDQQVLANDLYKKMLTIVGMPSTGDGNTSDSSNNGSTIVRNGWQHAEARAKDTATLWQRSDREFLRIALTLCDALAEGAGRERLNLLPEDVDCKFTRRNYEDIMTKATVLTTLMGNGMTHPKTAWQVANLVPDPEEAYQEGISWHEHLMQETLTMQRLQAEIGGMANDRDTGASRDSGAAEPGASGAQRRGAEAGERQEDRRGENSPDSD